MSLLLPGKMLYLNALLAMRKFRNCGNKAGAVRGFEELQANGLGNLHSIKPQRGASMVSVLCSSHRFVIFLSVHLHCICIEIDLDV